MSAGCGAGGGLCGENRRVGALCGDVAWYAQWRVEQERPPSGDGDRARSGWLELHRREPSTQKPRRWRVSTRTRRERKHGGDRLGVVYEQAIRLTGLVKSRLLAARSTSRFRTPVGGSARAQRCPLVYSVDRGALGGAWQPARSAPKAPPRPRNRRPRPSRRNHPAGTALWRDPLSCVTVRVWAQCHQENSHASGSPCSFDSLTQSTPSESIGGHTRYHALGYYPHSSIWMCRAQGNSRVVRRGAADRRPQWLAAARVWCILRARRGVGRRGPLPAAARVARSMSTGGTPCRSAL